jgi:hypothetical protein
MLTICFHSRPRVRHRSRNNGTTTPSTEQSHRSAAVLRARRRALPYRRRDRQCTLVRRSHPHAIRSAGEVPSACKTIAEYGCFSRNGAAFGSQIAGGLARWRMVDAAEFCCCWWREGREVGGGGLEDGLGWCILRRSLKGTCEIFLEPGPVSLVWVFVTLLMCLSVCADDMRYGTLCIYITRVVLNSLLLRLRTALAEIARRVSVSIAKLYYP